QHQGHNQDARRSYRLQGAHGQKMAKVKLPTFCCWPPASRSTVSEGPCHVKSAIIPSRAETIGARASRSRSTATVTSPDQGSDPAAMMAVVVAITRRRRLRPADMWSDT